MSKGRAGNAWETSEQNGLLYPVINLSSYITFLFFNLQIISLSTHLYKLTPRPLLVPWSRKSRTIPLRPLWTVRPVQSLSAWTRVHFTYLTHLYISEWDHLNFSRFWTLITPGFQNAKTILIPAYEQDLELPWVLFEGVCGSWKRKDVDSKNHFSTHLFRSVHIYLKSHPSSS